jgi:hypothetical protein
VQTCHFSSKGRTANTIHCNRSPLLYLSLYVFVFVLFVVNQYFLFFSQKKSIVCTLVCLLSLVCLLWLVALCVCVCVNLCQSRVFFECLCCHVCTWNIRHVHTCHFSSRGRTASTIHHDRQINIVVFWAVCYMCFFLSHVVFGAVCYMLFSPSNDHRCIMYARLPFVCLSVCMLFVYVCVLCVCRVCVSLSVYCLLLSLLCICHSVCPVWKFNNTTGFLKSRTNKILILRFGLVRERLGQLAGKLNSYVRC